VLVVREPASLPDPVVPDLTGKLVHAARTLFEKDPLVLGPAVYEKLPIKILRPYEIGSDLVCNAFAAYTFFKRSCVVIDFGTALTFTTLSQDGEILGVSIAPGLKTAIKSLSQNTAKLFDVRPKHLRSGRSPLPHKGPAFGRYLDEAQIAHSTGQQPSAAQFDSAARHHLVHDVEGFERGFDRVSERVGTNGEAVEFFRQNPASRFQS